MHELRIWQPFFFCGVVCLRGSFLLWRALYVTTFFLAALFPFFTPPCRSPPLQPGVSQPRLIQSPFISFFPSLLPFLFVWGGLGFLPLFGVCCLCFVVASSPSSFFLSDLLFFPPLCLFYYTLPEQKKKKSPRCQRIKVRGEGGEVISSLYRKWKCQNEPDLPLFIFFPLVLFF